MIIIYIILFSLINFWIIFIILFPDGLHILNLKIKMFALKISSIIKKIINNFTTIININNTVIKGNKSYFCFLLIPGLSSFLLRSGILKYYNTFISEISDEMWSTFILLGFFYALYLLFFWVLFTKRSIDLYPIFKGNSNSKSKSKNNSNNKSMKHNENMKSLFIYYYLYYFIITIITFKILYITYGYFISLNQFNIDLFTIILSINLDYCFFFFVLLSLFLGILLVYTKGVDDSYNFDFKKGNNIFLKFGIFWVLFVCFINFINIYFNIFISGLNKLLDINWNFLLHYPNHFLLTDMFNCSEGTSAGGNAIGKDAPNFKDHFLLSDSNSTEPSRGRTLTRGSRSYMIISRDKTMSPWLRTLIFNGLDKSIRIESSSALAFWTDMAFAHRVISTPRYDPFLKLYLLPPVLANQNYLNCHRPNCNYCFNFNTLLDESKVMILDDETRKEPFYTDRPVEQKVYTIEDIHPKD